MTPDALAFASACLIGLSLVALLVLKVIRGGGGKTDTASGASTGRAASVEDDTDVKLRMALYYGTQTGTSERFAHEIAEEIKHRYGKTVVVRTSDIENLTADNAEDVLTTNHEPFAIFLQSTYGDGEPTDTSTDFVHWQGLTLAHFSAQLERFLWDRGCA
jgi:NADPH-ferrihemoprotein reductase